MAALFAQSDFVKPVKWLIISLCLKIAFYFLFIQVDSNPQRKWTKCFMRSADHSEYMKPMDNYYDKGTYAMDGQTEPYAGRMPGFVFPYMLFRALLSEQNSQILLGIFILLMSVLASYTAGLLMLELVKKRWAFLLTFFMMNCIPFYWYYDWTLHTNSLAVSCTVFFAYHFYRYLSNLKNKSLLYAGFFLAWMVMLRGFALVFLPVTFIYLAYFLLRSKINFLSIVRSLFILAFPFLLFESMWITRNYISLHKFIPFQTSFVPGSDSKNPDYANNTITKHSMMKVRELIFAWGGDNTWYFHNDDMAWFVRRQGPEIANFKFDERIFFDGFSVDSLVSLKESILFSFENRLNKKQQDSIELVIGNTAERYHKKFTENKKSYVLFIAPFKRLKNYIFRNITQDWPGPKFQDSHIVQKAFKLLSLGQYLLILISIAAFPIVHFLRKKHSIPFFSFLYLIILANILPFMWMINFAHFTYFLFGYTLMIMCFVYMVQLLSLSKKNG